MAILLIVQRTFYKEATEAAGRSFGSPLFEYLKIKRDAQKNK